MDWGKLHRRAGKLGMSLKQEPAKFLNMGFSGIMVAVLPYRGDGKAAKVEESEIDDESRDAIFETMLRLCRELEPEFG